MKNIQSRICIRDNVIEVAILQKEIHRAYMLLDFLTENIIGEVHFNDSTAHHRLCIRIAEKAMYVPENGCVMLVNNHIDCIKRLIAQCYLNPYDTKWMHHDIELVTSQGDGIMLLVCIDEVDR